MACEVPSCRKEHSNSPSDSRSFRNNSAQIHPHILGDNLSHNTSARYRQYDKHSSDSFHDGRQQTLCLRCGLLGHRANTCMSLSPSKPSRSFIIEWKDNKLVSVKSNKAICIMFNIQGSCIYSGQPHLSGFIPSEFVPSELRSCLLS